MNLINTTKVLLLLITLCLVSACAAATAPTPTTVVASTEEATAVLSITPSIESIEEGTRLAEDEAGGAMVEPTEISATPVTTSSRDDIALVRSLESQLPAESPEPHQRFRVPDYWNVGHCDLTMVVVKIDGHWIGYAWDVPSEVDVWRTEFEDWMNIEALPVIYTQRDVTSELETATEKAIYNHNGLIYYDTFGVEANENLIYRDSFCHNSEGEFAFSTPNEVHVIEMLTIGDDRYIVAGGKNITDNDAGLIRRLARLNKDDSPNDPLWWGNYPTLQVFGPATIKVTERGLEFSNNDGLDHLVLTPQNAEIIVVQNDEILARGVFTYDSDPNEFDWVTLWSRR